MDLMPYPPDWSRADSPEILTYWQKYSRHLWIRFCLILRDEDKHLAWRMTASAAVMAFILVLLLFMDSLPTARPVRQVKAVAVQVEEPELEISTLANLDPMLVEISYAVEMDPALTPAAYSWPVVEAAPKPAPAPFVDPFEMFAPPPQEEVPSQPEPASIPPMQFGENMPVRQKPELQLEMRRTDLTSDLNFTEQRVLQSFDSQFAGQDRVRSEQNLAWNPSSGYRPQDFASPLEPSSLDQLTSFEPAAKTPVSHDRWDSNNNEVDSRFGGDLILTKHCPEEVSENSPFTYTLKVKNRGKQTVEYVRVFEEQADLVYLNLEPPAGRVGANLCWAFTRIGPGEEKTMHVTCRAQKRDQIVNLQSTVEVMQSIAQATNVFVPDVTVSITLPVEVITGKDFPVEIVVSNKSEKTFQPSKLRLQLLKGVKQGEENDLTSNIEVPAPGKSLKIPITLTPVELGEAVLQADLHLEKSLTVPVTAYTRVAAAENSAPVEENQTGETPGKKQIHRLVANDL